MYEITVKPFIGTAGLTEIARVATYNRRNRREIIVRLMKNCEQFKVPVFRQALEKYQQYENAGWIDQRNGYIVVYEGVA